MVKVPEYPAGGAVRTPIGDPEGRSLSMNDAGVFGRSVAEFGGVAMNVAGIFQRERVESGTASLETQALTDFDEFKRSLLDDPDYESYQDKYREFARKKTEEYQKTADAGVWRRFKNDFGRIVASNAIDVKQQGWKKQIDTSRATMNVELEDLADLHARSSDPVDRARILELGADTILSRAENGMISAEQATAETIKWRNRLFDTQLRNDVQTDPDTALRALQTEGYEGLSEERRAVWIDRAQAESDQRRAERVRMQDREERIAQREKRNLQDSTAAELYILDAQGTLTTQQIIEASRSGALSSTDTKQLLKSTSTGRDNPGVVEGIYDRMIAGDDVRDELLEMRRADQITASTFNTIWGRNQTQLNKASPKTSYEQGRAYLNTVLTPSEYESNQIARLRKGEAMVEFDAWAQDNPDATRQETMDMARDIAERAALVGPEQFGAVGTLLPRFLVGSRENPDLQATERRLNQHYHTRHNGDLQAIFNDPDYRRDLDQFERFKRIVEGAK